MPFGFFFMDSYYLILVMPALLLSLYAQFKVKSTFSRYEKVHNSKRMSGADIARFILDANGLDDIIIERSRGHLTDHYDPRTRTVRLSEPVYSSTSMAAIGVAAHETGHAIQHKDRYAPLGLRSSLVPLAGIGSSAGPYLAILGLFFRSDFLLSAGLVLFSAAVVFYLVTLPVEFNASRRAVAILEGSGMFGREEIGPVKKVLSAAAMTYVASALVAVASLLRLILLANRRR